MAVADNTSGKRLVVLISGSGRNLQAIIDACQSGQINAQIVAVISNKAGVQGLQRAQQAGISNHVLNHQTFPTRECFDQALAELIDSFNPDLVILAGFMRILSDGFVSRYLGKMLNIHPSLLPRYPGLNTHQRALDAGDSEHGATVHFVTPELDAGPIVLQGKIKIEASDNASSLAERVMREVERRIYPQAVALFCNNQIKLSPQAPYRVETSP